MTTIKNPDGLYSAGRLRIFCSVQSATEIQPISNSNESVSHQKGRQKVFRYHTAT